MNIKTGRVLPDLRQAQAENERLQRELEELKKTRLNGRQISMKVADKGVMSLYGLGRFPVTLYYEQWIALLDHGDDIKAFLDDNKARMKLRE